MRLHSRVSLCLIKLAFVAASASAQTFNSTSGITIPDLGAATPYPGAVLVSGVSSFSEVRVTLRDINHTFSGDLQILLVSPAGGKVLLMSDCGNAKLLNADITFKDAAPPVPTTSGSLFEGGTYAPTVGPLGTIEGFPAPAPAGPYATTLGSLNGLSANGVWSLYVLDDFGGDSGSISFWSIEFLNDATTMTYQGIVTDNATPFTGNADVRLSLYRNPTGGTAIANATLLNTLVSDGLLNVRSPFDPSVFAAGSRFLELAVRTPAGTGTYTTLSPRQELSYTPFAATADLARTAESAQFANVAGVATVAASISWTRILDIPSSFAGWSLNSSGHTYTNFLTGVGTDQPASRLHVSNGNSGTTPHTNAAITAESFQNCYITALAPDLSETGFLFARPGNAAPSASGGIIFNSSAARDGLQFRAGSNDTFMTLTAAGRLGIGTGAPDQLLTVNGGASKPGGGSWTSFSDARLKHDVQPLTKPLDTLLSLRGVSFYYNDPAAIHELPGQRIGMIAQEVERVIPDWVNVGDSGYKTITYRGFEALTVESIRQLRDQHAAELEGLRRENHELRARLDAIEKRLQSGN